MKIQSQSQNFGALRIRPTVPDGYSELTGKGRAYATKAINMELQNPDAAIRMLEIARKFNAKMELGWNQGRDCFNIMTKKGSAIEKNTLKELSEYFKSKNLHFEVESTTIAQAKASCKNFITINCKKMLTI
jgi:hypothetical protein